MRSAQTAYRPQTRNRSTAPPRTQRNATRTRTTALTQTVAPRPRRKQARKTAAAPLPNSLSVMALLVAVLAVIGGILLASLGWQRQALALTQEEVALRSALDQANDERQHLLVAERRASNPRFTAARAADAGLSEIKLDQRETAAKPKATPKTTTTEKAAAKPQVSPTPLKAESAKPALTTNKAKPATTTAAVKAPQVAQKTEPTMPPTIAKNASVKAALAR